MYKPIVSLVLLPLCLAGCAANQSLPIANSAADGSHAVPGTAAADITVDYSDMNQPTVCRDIRRPESRIIVERQCYTPDADAPSGWPGPRRRASSYDSWHYRRPHLERLLPRLLQ